jgi:hypothetical protein
MGEFQAALGTPEASGLLAHFGLNATEVGMIAAMAFCTTALIKKHGTLPGWGILLSSAVACGIWAALWYVPDIPKPITAGIMAFVTVSGGWQGFKDILGKFQYGGTKPIEPMGSMDRGPSLPGGN